MNRYIYIMFSPTSFPPSFSIRFFTAKIFSTENHTEHLPYTGCVRTLHMTQKLLWSAKTSILLCCTCCYRADSFPLPQLFFFPIPTGFFACKWSCKIPRSNPDIHRNPRKMGYQPICNCIISCRVHETFLLGYESHALK